jgi:phosphate-selective porin
MASPTRLPSARARRLAGRATFAAIAAAGAAAALAAPAAADAPVHITVTCGSETFQATSGKGGSAAWVGERGGRHVVLLPAAVRGTSTAADGTARTFDHDLGGREGATTTCSFAFDLETKAGVSRVVGEGDFLVRGA